MMYIDYPKMEYNEKNIYDQLKVDASDKQKKIWVHHPSNKHIKFQIIGSPGENQLYPISNSDLADCLSRIYRYNRRFEITLMTHIQICIDLFEDIYMKSYLTNGDEYRNMLDDSMKQDIKNILESNNYKNLLIAIALHDIEEIIIGDIISPAAKAFGIYEKLELLKWIPRLRMMNQYVIPNFLPEESDGFMSFAINIALEKDEIGKSAKRIIENIDKDAITVEKFLYIKDGISSEEWGCINPVLEKILITYPASDLKNLVKKPTKQFFIKKYLEEIQNV